MKRYLMCCLTNEKVLISTIEDYFRLKLYEYNNNAKKFGVYLKPYHIVTKKDKTSKRIYVYLGRYWYKIEKGGNRIKWIYIGMKKPISELPDPPLNPLTILAIERINGEVCIVLDDTKNLNQDIVNSVTDLLKYILSRIPNCVENSCGVNT